MAIIHQVDLGDGTRLGEWVGGSMGLGWVGLGFWAGGCVFGWVGEVKFFGLVFPKSLFLLRSAVAGRIYKLCAKNTSNSGFDRTFMPCSD